MRYCEVPIDLVRRAASPWRAGSPGEAGEVETVETVEVAEDPLAGFQAVENSMAEREGRPPRKVVLGTDEEGDEGDAWTELEETIAASRVVARKAHKRAMESEDASEVAYYADLFGGQCIRLGRLMLAQIMEAEDIDERLKEKIDNALQQVMKELNIYL